MFISICYYYVVFVINAKPDDALFKAHPFDRPTLTYLSMLRVLFDYFRNLIFPVSLNCRYVDYLSFSLLEPKVLIAFVAVVMAAVLTVRKAAGARN